MIALPVAFALVGALGERAAEHVKVHIEAKAAESAGKYVPRSHRRGLSAPPDCAERWAAHARLLRIQAGPTGLPAGNPPNCPRPVGMR